MFDAGGIGRRVVAAALITGLFATTTGIITGAHVAWATGIPAGSWSIEETNAGVHRTWTIESTVSDTDVDPDEGAAVSYTVRTRIVATQDLGGSCTPGSDSNSYTVESEAWEVWPAGPTLPPWQNDSLPIPGSQTTVFTVATSTDAGCFTTTVETFDQSGTLDFNSFAVGCWIPAAWNVAANGHAPDGYDGGSFATVAVGGSDCEGGDGADLAIDVDLVGPPDQLVVGDEVSYLATVTNNGPQAAFDVRVTEFVTGFDVTSASTSLGACSTIAGVLCSLGTIEPGGSATVLVTGLIAPVQVIGVNALVGAASFDPDLSNNQDDITTPVGNTPPTAVDDLSLVEFDGDGPTPSASIDVLLNDFDPDGDALVAEFDLPSGFALLPPTTVVANPAADLLGEMRTDYVLMDGRGGTDSGEIAFEFSNCKSRTFDITRHDELDGEIVDLFSFTPSWCAASSGVENRTDLDTAAETEVFGITGHLPLIFRDVYVVEAVAMSAPQQLSWNVEVEGAWCADLSGLNLARLALGKQGFRKFLDDAVRQLVQNGYLEAGDRVAMFHDILGAIEDGLNVLTFCGLGDRWSGTILVHAHANGDYTAEFFAQQAGKNSKDADYFSASAECTSTAKGIIEQPRDMSATFTSDYGAANQCDIL